MGCLLGRGGVVDGVAEGLIGGAGGVELCSGGEPCTAAVVGAEALMGANADAGAGANAALAFDVAAPEEEHREG